MEITLDNSQYGVIVLGDTCRRFRQYAFEFVEGGKEGRSIWAVFWAFGKAVCLALEGWVRSVAGRIVPNVSFATGHDKTSRRDTNVQLGNCILCLIL